MRKGKSTITLANVTKRFGDFEAVSDVTLAVEPGQVVGFVGPNGAGKTTTISMMMGFLKPSKGTVTVLGTNIEPQTSHSVHGSIGYVAGDMVLPGALSGRQFLAFSAARNGRIDERFNSLVDKLQPVLHKPLKQLSRGNKQKIALIAALQHAPTVLILDEPTSGLDPLMQDVFLDTVKDESKRGTTVFMSSHILSEVSSVCDRIVFMRAGKFILDKPVRELTSQLGKHIVIKGHDVGKLAKFLPDSAKLLYKNANEIRLSIPSANIKTFMRWIVTKEFDDILIEDRDLDDVFHELYGGKTK